MDQSYSPAPSPLNGHTLYPPPGAALTSPLGHNNHAPLPFASPSALESPHDDRRPPPPTTTEHARYSAAAAYANLVAQRSPHSHRGASSTKSSSGSSSGTVGHNPYLAGLDPAALAREAAHDYHSRNTATAHSDYRDQNDPDAHANAQINSSSSVLSGGGGGSYDANAYLDRLGMSPDGKEGGNYASTGRHGGRPKFSSEVSF